MDEVYEAPQAQLVFITWVSQQQEDYVQSVLALLEVVKNAYGRVLPAEQGRDAAAQLRLCAWEAGFTEASMGFYDDYVHLCRLMLGEYEGGAWNGTAV